MKKLIRNRMLWGGIGVIVGSILVYALIIGMEVWSNEQRNKSIMDGLKQCQETDGNYIHDIWGYHCDWEKK